MAIFLGDNNDNMLPNGGDNSGDDGFFGFGGNDTLTGGAGKDTMNGGTGADTFVINAGSEVVAGERYTGGDGVDTLRVNSNSAVDFRTAVIDADVEKLWCAVSGVSTLLTTAQFGRFQYAGSAGSFVLYGGGSVNMTGRSVEAASILLADATTLNLTGTSRGLSVGGSSGNDVITVGDANGFAVYGIGGDDRITGGVGNDMLDGGAGKDIVNGGDGDDTLYMSDLTAGDRYIGGAGYDTLDLSRLAAPDGTVDLSTLSIGADLEELLAGGGGSGFLVTLTAAQLGNFQSVGAPQIELSGAGTADCTNVIIPTLIAGIILSDAGNTLILTGVQSRQSIFGGAGADTVYGTEGDDYVNGHGGNDSLHGGSGSDTLLGDVGRDLLDGGAGDDALNVDPGHYVAGETYIGGSGYDTLTLPGGTNLSLATVAADVEKLVANGPVTLSATQLDHFSNIATGALRLSGAGAANLAGAMIAPNQSFYLSAAGNTLSLAGAISSTPGVETSFTVNGGVGNDTITGGDGLYAFSSHNGGRDDALNGGAGNDKIIGGAGNDEIYGGAGKDALYGGANDDTLIIKSQTEIQAGEVYSGGNGIDDVLDIRTAAAMNLSSATISQIERLEALGNVSLGGATQLGAFTTVDTGDVTLTGAGVADLTNATVYYPQLLPRRRREHVEAHRQH